MIYQVSFLSFIWIWQQLELEFVWYKICMVQMTSSEASEEKLRETVILPYKNKNKTHLKFFCHCIILYSHIQVKIHLLCFIKYI